MAGSSRGVDRTHDGFLCHAQESWSAVPSLSVMVSTVERVVMLGSLLDVSDLGHFAPRTFAKPKMQSEPYQSCKK